MQSKESDCPSIFTTVRSTPLIAIESPARVPSSTVRQPMRSRPSPDSITDPTSSIMPVNILSKGCRVRRQGSRRLRLPDSGVVGEIDSLRLEFAQAPERSAVLVLVGGGLEAPNVAVLRIGVLIHGVGCLSRQENRPRSHVHHQGLVAIRMAGGCQ